MLLCSIGYIEIESVQGQQQEQNKTALVSLGGVNVTASLSTTPDSQSKGLSIKDSLNENEGMLFIFDSPQKYSFWMKDMKFPIDIIWINSTGNIVHIEKNLSPCYLLLPCPSYAPNNDSLYVLEVASNFTNKFGVSVGDSVESEIIKRGQH
ncbi:MAG: DUF192 domain-containing protein [Candidatus Nitrosocosmicus sp.]|nr:DUF192 domain-containing protein [Candidatus Nitrosocosmicus sp.]